MNMWIIILSIFALLLVEFGTRWLARKTGEKMRRQFFDAWILRMHEHLDVIERKLEDRKVKG